MVIIEEISSNNIDTLFDIQNAFKGSKVFNNTIKLFDMYFNYIEDVDKIAKQFKKFIKDEKTSIYIICKFYDSDSEVTYEISKKSIDVYYTECTTKHKKL